MKRMIWAWAAVGGMAGLVFLGGRWAGPLSAGEPGAGDSPGYVPGVPGPVTALLPLGRADAAFAGTGWGVYRSRDGGRTWARVFRAGIWKGPVRALAADAEGKTLYAAAGDGLYRSSGEEGRWGRVLAGRRVTCVAVSPQDPALLLAGTDRGVMVSLDGGGRWEAQASGCPRVPVRQVLFDPARRGTCYLVSERGFFLSKDDGRSWEQARIDPAGVVETAEANRAETEAEEARPQEEQEAGSPGSHRLAVDPQGNLYLGTRAGVLTSPDGGGTWQPIATERIGTPDVLHLVPDPAEAGLLYAVTPAGLFAYSSAWKAWRPIREGAGARGADSVALDARGRQLWVGTRRGLFRLPVPAGGPRVPSLEGDQPIRVGPPISAVHAAAVRYAEVHPAKISRWRALARWRSLFPSFTIRLDQDRDATIASSTTLGVTRFTVGPEKRTRSLNFGFTWDVADLIWNPDQTAIDVRSRLMVQLRQDLLEEVTRLYFERRRLLAEFAGNPSEDPLLDEERSLRVEELTAQLDALTGGWFSENN